MEKSMRLELEASHEESLQWSEQLAPESDDLRHAGVRLLTEVGCEGTVFHSPPEYIVKGGLTYRQRLQCFRCLEPFEEDVETDFDLVVQLRRNGAPGDEIELEESDLDVLILDEPILETEPLAVEQIQLHVSMKPLCREDCKGLCATCGVNLNTVACSCAAPAADSRFAGLAGLKAKLEE